MKKQIVALMISVSVFAMRPAFAMDEKDRDFRARTSRNKVAGCDREDRTCLEERRNDFVRNLFSEQNTGVDFIKSFSNPECDRACENALRDRYRQEVIKQSKIIVKAARVQKALNVLTRKDKSNSPKSRHAHEI